MKIYVISFLLFLTRSFSFAVTDVVPNGHMMNKIENGTVQGLIITISLLLVLALAFVIIVVVPALGAQKKEDERQKNLFK